MRHSTDCIYHPGQEAPPPQPKAKVPCCKAGKAYMVKRADRRARNQVMRDCGLVRVRGALGGIYWE